MLLITNTWSGSWRLSRQQISDRSPGCRDLRTCMSPWVRHTTVITPRFENTTQNHKSIT